MERLTKRWPDDAGSIAGRAVCEFLECDKDDGCENCRHANVNNRLAAIEDILGDDYDLDRLRELVENDKSCYTCKNYKGRKICGFKGFDVGINPQEGCAGREAALRRKQDG